MISVTKAVTTFDTAPPMIKPIARPTIPCSLMKLINAFMWCRRRDLNSQPLREPILSRSRIPIPPLRHIFVTLKSLSLFSQKINSEVLCLLQYCLVVRQCSHIRVLLNKHS